MSFIFSNYYDALDVISGLQKHIYYIGGSTCMASMCRVLSLSIEKTEYSIFYSARSKIPDNCDQLNFRNFTINRVSSSKYLRMLINNKLTWDSHINYLVGQLVKYTGIFKLISKLIPHSCKRQLYFANIYSRDLYGVEVYEQDTSNAEPHD